MKEKIEISTGAAARILGCTSRSIVAYCRAGKLTGRKNPISGVWLVELTSVYALKEGQDNDSRV